MAGRRKRRRLAERQFSTAMEDLDQELTVLRKRIQEALGDQEQPVQEGNYLYLTEARQRLQTIIQRNFDAVLKEADVSQRIRESRHRMKTDDEVIAHLRSFVPENFVSVDDVRTRLTGHLSAVLGPDVPVDTVVDVLFPLPERKGYERLMMAEWTRQHGTAVSTDTDGQDPDGG